MKILTLYLSLLFSVVSHASSEVSVVEVFDGKPEITIVLPASYEIEKSKNYPVIYVLDGELNSGLVKSMLDRLYASNGSHEHIVVGIESTDRLRDFAPTVNMDPRGPVGAGGGADKFLDYLQTDLIPLINSRYRTNNDKTIAGHSIAGLFVIHSFHIRPKLFQAHLAFSPAVWWGERETAKAAENYVSSGIKNGSFLYLNIGNEGGEMREVYDSFVCTLARNRSLDLVINLDEFKHSEHDFTMSAGLYNALRGLYKYQQRVGR